MNHKFLLISINSYDELTGGGVYLRTLISFLLKQNINLSLIDKNINGIHHKQPFKRKSLNKNKFRDVISRLFLLPSFYVTHIFTILRECQQNDIIGLHNSRLGLMVPFFRFLYPNKKIIIFSDNFEYDLLLQKEKSLANKLELSLVKFNEKLGYTLANGISYITVHDKKQTANFYKLENKKTCIVPVVVSLSPTGLCENSCKIRDEILDLKKRNEKKFIFTASFDFFPNVTAAHQVYKSAELNSDVLFILAGRKALNLNLPRLNNLIIVEDLSVAEMSELLNFCDIFYSPIKLGSGMKTKVAEALSFGLHIYASELTLIGYEDIIYDKECVTIMRDCEENIPSFLKTKSFSKKTIIDKQVTYYSPSRFKGDELGMLLN